MRVWLVFCVLAACHREATSTFIDGVPRRSDVPRDTPIFDCDAPADARSEWAQPTEHAGTARGAIYFAVARENAKYPPAADILVTSEHGGTVAGIKFTLDAGYRHLLPFVMARESRSAKPKLLSLGQRPIYGASFELAWETGHLRVRGEAAGPWVDVPLSFKPAWILFGCNASNAVFYSLHVAPTTAATAPRHMLPPTPPGDQPPQNVPPTQLEQLRIAGTTDVTPDPETQAQITAAGTNHVVGSFKLCIDDKGEPSALEQLKSTGYPAYDDKIAAAIEQWRYSPYRVQDRAVPVCTAVTFIYRTPVVDRPETPHERALREWHEQHSQ